MIALLVALGGFAAVAIAYVVRQERTSAATMIADFQQAFPGQCPICSFHRFGLSHGMTRQAEPASHACPEHGELAGSYRTTHLVSSPDVPRRDRHHPPKRPRHP